MVSEKCGVCQEVGTLKCGGCQNVYYCSKEHQKEDYKKHKPQCKTYTICEDNELGRHLVSSRDIKAGEVVIRESPLLVGPSQVTGPVCLGCMKGLTATNSEPCPLCGWPLCKKDSCKKSEHHIPECQWTSEKKGLKVKISQFVTPHPTYECITPLRLCYMMCKSEMWQPFAKLESHCAQRKGTFKYESDRQSVAQFLQRFYKLDMTEEQILKACGIIQVNGHEVATTNPPHVAVYNHASLLEHSCLPTCSKTFTTSGDLVVYSVVTIPKGTHLSISYTDALWGTMTRRHHLAETKFFSCNCPRCKDPTELGTFFSALACQQSDCTGSVLPTSFCDKNSEKLPWTCNQCRASLQAKDVAILLDKVGQEMFTLSEQDISVSQKFLDKWEPYLHKNHYYLTEARLGLAQRYGDDDIDGIQKITDSELSHKIKLCKQLLELFVKIVPAEYRVLGMLNFQLYLSINEVGRRRSTNGELDPQDIQNILLESKKLLEDCVSYLLHEPETLPEGRMMVQARQALMDLIATLRNMQSAIGISPL